MIFFPGSKKPELPQYWYHYQEMNLHANALKLPLEALTFTVIDVESTGLDLKKDKMIAFAGIRIRNLKISVRESLEIVIRHEVPSQDHAIHLHELTNKEKNEGIPENEALEEILHFVGNSILVGYHVGLDHGLINRSLNNLLGKKLLNHVLDIPDLIRRVEAPVQPVYPSRYLDLRAQSEAFGVEMMDQHTAAGDAFTAAQLFLKVLSKLRKRGVRDLNGLRKNGYCPDARAWRGD